MNTEKQVIEINGVKMEVDMRYAKRIEHVTIGTRVKVLRKSYGDQYNVLHGVVIGFEPFKELPTIIIAVASLSYTEAKIEFIYFNTSVKDVEVVVACNDDLVALDKEDFIKKVDVEIEKKKLEIRDLQDKKAYFLQKFKCYWEAIEQAVADATS